ncbi:hypothetical protein GCM10022206_18340 [Streptomyces chiangmaiensis]
MHSYSAPERRGVTPAPDAAARGPAGPSPARTAPSYPPQTPATPAVAVIYVTATCFPVMFPGRGALKERVAPVTGVPHVTFVCGL